MANWFEPTEKQLKEFKDWVAKLPEHVRPIAERLPPWGLFRLKDGHRVTVYCVSEHADGSISVCVDVTGRFNFVGFERRVFGIDPNDLTPCDLPDSREITGSLEIPFDSIIKSMKAEEN